MNPAEEMFVTVVLAVLGSTGLWQLISKLTEKKSAQGKLLLGLAHDRILHLGTKYIERGYITPDEYENIYDYLYLPHKAMGGDGAAERMIAELKKLPIRKEDNQ